MRGPDLPDEPCSRVSPFLSEPVLRETPQRLLVEGLQFVSGRAGALERRQRGTLDRTSGQHDPVGRVLSRRPHAEYLDQLVAFVTTGDLVETIDQQQPATTTDLPAQH